MKKGGLCLWFAVLLLATGMFSCVGLRPSLSLGEVNQERLDTNQLKVMIRLLNAGSMDWEPQEDNKACLQVQWFDKDKTETILDSVTLCSSEAIPMSGFTEVTITSKKVLEARDSLMVRVSLTNGQTTGSSVVAKEEKSK